MHLFIPDSKAGDFFLKEDAYRCYSKQLKAFGILSQETGDPSLTKAVEAQVPSLHCEHSIQLSIILALEKLYPHLCFSLGYYNSTTEYLGLHG